MLETLLKILSYHYTPSLEIMLGEDGCLELDTPGVSISIWPDGKVSWAIDGQKCGNKLDDMIAALEKWTEEQWMKQQPKT